MLIEDFESDMAQNLTCIKKFVCKHVGDDIAKEVDTDYHQTVLDFIPRDKDTTSITRKLKYVLKVEPPLDNKGLTHTIVANKWEKGQGSSAKPLVSTLADDDPVGCTVYAKEDHLLKAPGWKHFKLSEKTYLTMVKQAEIVWLFNMTPTYKYGFELPYNYLHVLRRDVLNKNSKWQNSVDTKLKPEVKLPSSTGHHKKIRVHLVDDGESAITTAFMTMSSVMIALVCQGHMDSVTVIRLCTEEADYCYLPDIKYYNWPRSVYGELSEVLPTKDALQPLVCYVMLSHYVDANLTHSVLMGRSVTGILHNANRTQVDWFSKKQGTIETFT